MAILSRHPMSRQDPNLPIFGLNLQHPSRFGIVIWGVLGADLVCFWLFLVVIRVVLRADLGCFWFWLFTLNFVGR